mgnify:CR=1 FL=1
MSERAEWLAQHARRIANPRLLALAAIAVAGWFVVTHPPTQTVAHGESGIRVNRLTGSFSQVGEGVVVMVPGVHELRSYPLRDQVYKPVRSAKANGEAPFQSSEGLSIGVELQIRYALDPNRLIALQGTLPTDIGTERVEPAAQGTLYKVFTKYTVREIFSNKRQQIQEEIEKELRPKLLADGIVLKSVMMGNVDLPADYRAGMDQLLAVELESERMKYTLELKEKQLKEAEMQADSEKMVREKAAEAAGQEQIIAAKAQAEAMKHVIPFKQKQIEQRQFEAEAEKVARIKQAEAAAQARRIEAAGEADRDEMRLRQGEHVLAAGADQRRAGQRGGHLSAGQFRLFAVSHHQSRRPRASQHHLADSLRDRQLHGPDRPDDEHHQSDEPAGSV